MKMNVQIQTNNNLHPLHEGRLDAFGLQGVFILWKKTNI